jgi:UMF1 family MFS transporter
MYDWANSAFALVITAAVFPPFFLSVSQRFTGVDKTQKAIIEFLGFRMESSALYNYILSLAFFILMCLSPLLSGIADARGLKKRMMRTFCYLGSFASIMLLFFDEAHYWIGIVGIIVGMIGYNGSIIYYNAFLPLITKEENYDRVSARGYAYGYLGSVILLIINLLMIKNPEWFGLSGFEHPTTVACQVSFAMVGLWWIGFSQITFRALPAESIGTTLHKGYFRSGFETLRNVWKELKHLPHTRRYLTGFFFCAMALQTILYIATLYSKEEIHLSDTDNIIMVLLLQFVGTIGAVLFAKISDTFGNIRTICLTLVIWIFVCFAAYMVTERIPFFIIASLVGMVMGALQSLNRSTYSKLIPENSLSLSSYFSFMDVTEKAAITLGTLSTGLVTDITGSLRNAILLYSACFLVALLFYSRVKLRTKEFAAA